MGGGHAHVHVLRSFGQAPVPGVRLVLVARERHTPYSGMLPGLIAGHYRFEECHIDLAPLARFAGAELVHAAAVGLDRAAGRVLLDQGAPVGYDLLSLDIGITPALDAIAGASEHATPVKPISRFLDRWREVEARIVRAPGTFRLAVVGTGAGGVEVLLAARHRLGVLLAQRGGALDRLACTLLGRRGVLPSHNPAVRRAFTRVLAERGVRVLGEAEVVAIEPDRVVCRDGREVAADAVLLVTNARAPDWLRATGLALDRHGFVAVDASLRSTGDPSVFAVGDVASVLPHPRPKAGVFAVRQGPPLARNLRLAAAGQEPEPFHPQHRFLSLITTGDRYVVGSRGGWKLEGRWLWRVKDRIDRRWMRQYQELPSARA